VARFEIGVEASFVSEYLNLNVAAGVVDLR